MARPKKSNPPAEYSPGNELKKRLGAAGLSEQADIPKLASYRPLAAMEQLDAELLVDTMEPLTVARAAEYLERPAFTGERPVHSDHVDQLVKFMNAGRFNWAATTIVTAELDGTTYRINGQHTAYSRLGMPAGFEAPAVRFLHYRVRTLAQLKALYTTFDPAFGARTRGHLIRVELADTPATEGLNARSITVAAHGYQVWKFPERDARSRIQPSEVAALVAEDANLFNLVGQFFQSIDQKDNRRVVDRSPVIAAMFETFSKVPTKAPEFWRRVADGEMLARLDARYQLRRFLLDVALQRSGASVNKKVIGHEEMYRSCINAWNRWRVGEEVTRITRPKRESLDGPRPRAR